MMGVGVSTMVAMCPEVPAAYSLMGYVHFTEYWLRIAKSPQESIENGIEMAQKALAIDDSVPIAHVLLSSFYLQRREYEKAIAEAERAVALDPGGALAYECYATSLNAVGRSGSHSIVPKSNPPQPCWYHRSL